MALSVSVTTIEGLSQAQGFFDGIAVVQVHSDFGPLTIKVPFQQKTTVDEGIKDALLRVKNFAILLHNTILV